MGTTDRSRRNRPAVLAVVAVVAFVAVAARAEAAFAAGEDRGVAIDVSVGVNGSYEPADPVLVRVRVTADDVIDGELVAHLNNTAITHRQPVELAAGTTKEYTFLLSSTWDLPKVDVTVTDHGDEVASVEASARPGEDELVGVLPRLAGRFEELVDVVTLPEHVGRAQITAVTPAVLDLGVPGLQTFDTIVAGGDDLAALGDGQRLDVLTWVSLGGMLMLDDASGLDSLPEEWRPGDAGYSWAGLGEIHVVDGAASGGDWADFLMPTLAGPNSMFASEMMFDPQVDLARRSGVDRPSVSLLAAGLAVYAVLLGPGLYLVLRRRRRLTLGWLVIPAVAVLTAGGIAVAGADAFGEGEPATATFVQTTPGGTYAVSSVLTFTPGGGRSELTIPARWGPMSSNGFFFDGASVPVELRRNADGTTTSRMSLEAMQASVRSYEGPTAAEALEVTATLDGDTISGTVTNNTGHDLHDVAVFAGTKQKSLDELAAGESATWELRAPQSLPMLGDSRGVEVWGGGWGFDGRPTAAEGSAELGIWGTASGRIELFPHGMARAVGWTDEIPTDLLDGEISSRTAVSAVVPITSDVVGAATVRATALRGPFTQMGGMGNDQVIRYVVQPSADASELFVVGHGDEGIREISFWDGGAWVAADADLDAVPVPAAALRHGSVLVLTDLDMNRGPAGIPVLTDDPDADTDPRPDEGDGTDDVVGSFGTQVIVGRTDVAVAPVTATEQPATTFAPEGGRG